LPFPLTLHDSLLWGAALVISFFTLQYWNFHGSLPGYDKRRLPAGGDSSIDPHKADFSMAPHDEEAYAPINMDERDPGRGDEYASGAYGGGGAGGGSTYSNPQDAYDDTADGTHGGGYVGSAGGTAYTAGANAGSAGYSGRVSPVPQQGTGYVPPTATDYDDGPAQFPAANYERTIR
jgi:hypothetical protein